MPLWGGGGQNGPVLELHRARTFLNDMKTTFGTRWANEFQPYTTCTSAVNKRRNIHERRENAKLIRYYSVHTTYLN